VVLAARGARDMDAGHETVADLGEAAALRRAARVILAQSLVIAALMTVVAWLSAAG
jgi:hypothetical protein